MELQKHAFNFALFISPALSKCPRCSTCPSWPFIQLPLYQLLDTSLQFTETTRIFTYFHCWNCRFLLSVKLPQKSELEIGQAKLQQWVRTETKWEKVAKDQQGRSRQPTVKVALAGNLPESTKTQVPSHVCSTPVARVDKRTTSFWRDGHKVLPRNLGTFMSKEHKAQDIFVIWSAQITKQWPAGTGQMRSLSDTMRTLHMQTRPLAFQDRD